jgi:CheY-like chemotaxis protein
MIPLTAHAMVGDATKCPPSCDRKKALAAGCDEYDTKPIKMPRLLGKIKTLMQKVQ